MLQIGPQPTHSRIPIFKCNVQLLTLLLKSKFLRLNNYEKMDGIKTLSVETPLVKDPRNPHFFEFAP